MGTALKITLLVLAIGGVNGLGECNVQVDDACIGRTVKLADGVCYNISAPCNDDQTCTNDVCSSDGMCSFQTGEIECSKCMTTCQTGCAGKECGNDPGEGCAGTFCGTCQEGQACSADQKCTSAEVPGSCTQPFSIVEGDTISKDETYTVAGDTTLAAHILTPLCNFRSASGEHMYKFTIPEGKSFGFEIRTSGYDTVLSVMKEACRTNATIACSDDATPPGDYGSSVSGMANAGTYYVQVDGYDSSAKGPFTMTAKFKATSRSCKQHCRAGRESSTSAIGCTVACTSVFSRQ